MKCYFLWLWSAFPWWPVFLSILKGSIGHFCVFLPERFIGSIDYFLNGAWFASWLIAFDFFSSYIHKHCVKYEDEILCAILQTIPSVKWWFSSLLIQVSLSFIWSYMYLTICKESTLSREQDNNSINDLNIKYEIMELGRKDEDNTSGHRHWQKSFK